PQRAERAWRRLLAAREATGASAADLAAVRERIADCLAASDRRGEALAERLRAMSERSPAPADATRVAMPPAATRDAPAKSSHSAQPDASRDVSPKAPGATDSAPAAQSPPPLALRIFALAGAANSGIRSALSGLRPRSEERRVGQ